jgi:hypothetical protein
LEGKEVFVVICGSGRGEGVLPVVEHVTSVVGSEGAGLGPEVQEDGIGFPAAQGSDGRLVHPRDEESGGPPGAEAVGGDAVGRNVREMLDRGGSGAEFGGDGAGGDVVGNARSVEVSVQGALGWYVVLAEVKDTALGGSDGAESVIAGAAVAKGLAACGILLVGVGETDISPTLHVMRRALGGGSPLDGGIAEGGVSKAERFATAAVGGGGEGVLARSAKEVEPDGGEVGDGFGP